MITKVFIPQLVQSLFGINWFGFTGLFGSARLFVNTSREKGGKKRCYDLNLIKKLFDICTVNIMMGFI